MGLFKHFRAKTQSKIQSAPVQHAVVKGVDDLIRKLPQSVLELIFAYVCPHTQDRTYLSSEDVPIGSDCMLCDLRDLANCLQVCSRWRTIAEPMLYGSIRIDAVHYCILEEELALKRNKTGKFKKSKYIDAVEIPGIRLGLLCETLRGNSQLAEHVQYLKLPYMTRESSKADLARTVAVLPNLRYVDLPEGFFTGHESYGVLRSELQAQCPKLGKMQYRAGSEPYLNHLLQRRWQHLECLELKGIAPDISTLQLVLASLPALHDLTLADMPWLDNSMFSQGTQLASMPAIKTLRLENVPNITAHGLSDYLSSHHNQQTLTSLTLHNTGVSIVDLHEALWKATSLRHLSIMETVSKAMVMHKDMPYLTSPYLRHLTFDIEIDPCVQGLQRPDDSYYAYLASSLYAGALPRLAILYVRERQFPERLMPDMAAYRISNVSAQASGLNQTLQVFSKGADEVQWLSTPIGPSGQRRHSTASSDHRVSAFVAPAVVPPWAREGLQGGPRMSMVASNGRGSFIALPQEGDPPALADDARAGASQHYEEHLRPPPSLALLKAKRDSRSDLWR